MEGSGERLLSIAAMPRQVPDVGPPTSEFLWIGTGHICMLAVALQVGLQPAVTRACVAKEVSGQSLVLAEISVSMLLAIVLTPWEAFANWFPWESLLVAGPPAFLYAVRSMFKQAAYRRCDGVTFNVINQTKVVFCAIGAYFLMGEMQTMQQCLALLCAVSAGALLVLGTSSAPAVAGSDGTTDLKGMGSDTDERPEEPASRKPSPKIELSVPDEKGRRKGCGTIGKDSIVVVPTPSKVSGRRAVEAVPSSGKVVELAASSASGSGAVLALATAMCSGMAAALSQLAMRKSVRPSTLFNFELSLWGAPFALAAGGKPNFREMMRGWRLTTFAPVALQAVGGLLVSAVLQREGGVAMGLCTVAGIAVSAAADAILDRRLPTHRQVLAALLAASSIVVHQYKMDTIISMLPAGLPLYGETGVADVVSRGNS